LLRSNPVTLEQALRNVKMLEDVRLFNLAREIREDPEDPFRTVSAPIPVRMNHVDLPSLEQRECSAKEAKNLCRLGVSPGLPVGKSSTPVVELKQSVNMTSCGEVPFSAQTPDVTSPTSPRCYESIPCTTFEAAKPVVAPPAAAAPSCVRKLVTAKRILKRRVDPITEFFEKNKLVLESKDYQKFMNKFKDFVSWPEKKLARALICKATNPEPVMCGVIECFMHLSGIDPAVVVKEWCGEDLPPSMLQKPVVDGLFMHILQLLSAQKPVTPGGVFLRLLKRCPPYARAKFFCDPAHPLSSKKGVIERDYYLKLWDTHTGKLRDVNYYKFLAKLEWHADTKNWLSEPFEPRPLVTAAVVDSASLALIAPKVPSLSDVLIPSAVSNTPVKPVVAAPNADDYDAEWSKAVREHLAKADNDDWLADMERRIDALYPEADGAPVASPANRVVGIAPPPPVAVAGQPAPPINPPKVDEPVGDFTAPIDCRYQPRINLPFNLLDPDTYDAPDCPGWLCWLRHVHTPGKRVRSVGARLEVPDWKYNDQEKVPTTRTVANVRVMQVTETPSRWFFESWLGIKNTTSYNAVVSGSAVAVAETVIKGGDYCVEDVINQLRFSKDVIQPAGRYRLEDGSVVDTLNCNRESVNYVLDRRAALGTFQQGNVRGPSRGVTSSMATAQVNNPWHLTLLSSLIRYASAMKPVMIVVSCILTWVAVFVATYYLPPTLATLIRSSLA
jgi:hypothetical protein